MTKYQYSKKILCVEDEKDLRENIAFFLNKQGFDIIEAGDGEEAFSKYVDEKPNLILCDINMPKMNGHELLIRIKDQFPESYNNTPFIFLTALGQKNDFIKGLEIGADEYVVKPIDFDVLLSLINSKLEKHDINQQITKNSLDKFCDQVSHLLPNEIQEPLDNILAFSKTMKTEALGAFIDKKYIELSSKIYMSALKLNMQVSKALSKEKIYDEIENLKDDIDLNIFLADLQNIFKDFPVMFVNRPNLPSLRANQELLKQAIISYLTQQINSKAREISFNIFVDFQENLVISVSSFTSLPVVSEDLEAVLGMHSGKFSIIEKDNKTYHLLTFPNFLITTLN